MNGSEPMRFEPTSANKAVAVHETATPNEISSPTNIVGAKIEICLSLQVNNHTISMKHSLLTLLCIALIGCAGPQQQEQNTSTMNKENNELIAFDVQKEFQKNGFDWFTENLILCSGDTTESNAMTIGWGGIGNYLGHDRPAVTVYVAPGRFTWEFMEKYPRFTIMQFDDPEIWKYLGSHSGRDGDKAAALGLHVAYTEHGTPYYEEANLVIECETMTAWHQTEQDFRNDTPKKWYDGFDAGIHTVYIGEVIGAWKLSACAQNKQQKENKEMKKTLVVYFSATGTTKAAAQKLAKEHNADLYEIVPEQPYTAADLDWRDKTSRSTLEMKDKSSRPAIKGRCENIADYDTVWIGFPVWWYTAPTIVNTFIEAHDLSGKTLNVFATSGGSTVTGSYNDLKSAYPQYTWGESRLMND